MSGVQVPPPLLFKTHRRLSLRWEFFCARIGESGSPLDRQTRVTADIDAPCGPWAIDHHSNPRRHTLIVEAQLTINGSKAAIWAAITNIENTSENHQWNRKH